MPEPWVKKYQPKRILDIVGQKAALQAVMDFVREFPAVRKKALILFGLPGIGKTAISHAIASEFDFELVELNASDFRTKDSIISILGNASKQASLFGNKKIIVVDEIDGISGQQDRGGVSAIIDVIKETKFPIIITANDVYSEKLKTLRTYCQLVELKGVSSAEVIKKLEDICQKEGIEYEKQALQKLATAVEGDLRAAINDLQTIAENRKLITEADIKLWGREKEESIFNLLKLVFKSFDSEAMLRTSDYVDEDLDRIILWLDQNIPAEYMKAEEYAFAYDNLAEADRFLKRIMRWQHWRFLVYARILSLVGVQQAKTEVNRRFVLHQRPELLLKLWIRAAKRRKAQSLAENVSSKLHASAYELQKNFWPYYQYISDRNPEYAAELNEFLGLE